MKTAFLSLTLLCVPAGAFSYDFFGEIAAKNALQEQLPRADASTALASGFISVWTQDCAAEHCGLPQGLMPARKVAFNIALPAGPGSAQIREVRENFVIEGGELNVRLSFYSICPYGAAEGCPSRYFQVQAELSGAASAFCAASLNAGDFFPFPVFMCAGAHSPGRRLGITLHRVES